MKALLPDDPRWIGPHHMIAVIGRGSMGRVLLGRTPTGKLVAVKQIPRSHTEDLEFRARLQRELETGKQLTDALSGAVVDSDLDAERPWLATEYLPAPDLATVIAGCGPLPVPGLRLLATGLAAALLEVHRSVLVHRRLEPGNVLLTPEGPRIIDFGLARPRTGDDPAESSGFVPPEQAEGQPVPRPPTSTRSACCWCWPPPDPCPIRLICRRSRIRSANSSNPVWHRIPPIDPRPASCWSRPSVFLRNPLGRNRFWISSRRIGPTRSGGRPAASRRPGIEISWRAWPVGGGAPSAGRPPERWACWCWVAW